VDATAKAASPSPVIFKRRLANAFFILAHQTVLYSFMCHSSHIFMLYFAEKGDKGGA
jgi:hypothetical protein